MSLSSQLAVARREFTVEVDLDVAAETLVIVGPSGCGKTTVLRALAGLLAPDRARIRLDGRLLHDTEQNVTLPPERRQIGVVFQNYALFPHLDVARNLAYGLGATPRADRDRRVRVAMQRVRITHLARSRPAQLSGGEQQRVAVARALITEPRLLLLDEPLSALDIDTRTSVRRELAVLLRELAIPTIVVTHDLRDAEVLADRIAVMDRGRIVQIGTPTEVTTHPVNAFLAQFTGTNLIPATLLDPDAAPDTVLAVDPAQIRLTRPHAGDRSGWATTITTLQPRGSTVRVGLSIPPDTVAELPAEQAQAMRLAVIIGVPTVPIGIYTRQILAKANNIYGPGFSDQVLGHVVSTETDVKQVLHKVALDEADAGIVYRTDVTPQLATQLRVIDIPTGLQVNAINYIAVPVHAPHPAAAHQLLDYLLSAPGQAVFTHFGYLPLTTPATTTAAPSPPLSRGAPTPGG